MTECEYLVMGVWLLPVDPPRIWYQACERDMAEAWMGALDFYHDTYGEMTVPTVNLPRRIHL